MKTTISLVITLLVMAACSFAQTYEPSQARFWYHYGTAPIFLDQHPDFQQKDKFIITWHWYWGKKMSEALGVNTVHIPSEVAAYADGPLRYIDPVLDRIPDSSNLIVYPPYIGWHWYNGKKMSESLGVNLVHISPIDFWGRLGDPNPRVYAKTSDLKNVADSVFMVMNSSRISHGTNLYKIV